MYPEGCWRVSRMLQDGERYTVACYEKEPQARALLIALSQSIECQRGAEIEAGPCEHGDWVHVVPFGEPPYEMCRRCMMRRPTS